MNTTRFRLWPLMALFALLCTATAPAWAWACACDMTPHAASATSGGAARKLSAPTLSASAMAPDHSCCRSHAKDTPTTAPQLAVAPSHAPANSHSCCCQLSQRTTFVGGENVAWSGWNFAVFAVLPTTTLVVRAPALASTTFRPVAQSPPESPPLGGQRGRAPPVLAPSC